MTFHSASLKAGFKPNLNYIYIPESAGEALLDSAKDLAKLLTRTGSPLGHRQLLELIAQACDFPDWHSLQSFCKRTSTLEINSLDDPVLHPFSGAIPLLYSLDAVMSPAAAKKSLADFSEKLASSCHADIHKVLDSIAHLYGKPSWSDLFILPEEPEAKSYKVYTFSISLPEDGLTPIGHFRGTEVCDELMIDIHLLMTKYPGVAVFEKKETISTLFKTLHLHPGFIFGWLALCNIYTQTTRPQYWQERSLYFVLKGIEAAESLIPENFKGVIEWDWPENRAYLQLLHEAALIFAAAGEAERAVFYTKKLLKLSPGDDLSAETMLPSLLLSCNKDTAAKQLFKKIESYRPSNIIGDEAFVLSLYCLADELHSLKGYYYLLRALLTTSLLRNFLGLPPLPAVDYQSDMETKAPNDRRMDAVRTLMYEHSPQLPDIIAKACSDEAVVELELMAQARYHNHAFTPSGIAKQEFLFDFNSWCRKEAMRVAFQLHSLNVTGTRIDVLANQF